MRHYSLLFLTVVFLPGLANAQYKGGNDDGVSGITVSMQNALPNIYMGGGDDGFSGIAVLNQNALPGIYSGGTDDGVSSTLVLNQNALPGIYAGGIDDGVSSVAVTGQNALPNIYSGGLDDGISSIVVLNQNATPSIYLGGSDDGVTSIVAANENPLPGIYLGGVNDGNAISVSLNQNPAVPLPVTLLVFNGAWFNDDAVLAWKTGVEQGLDHFELQRSGDGGRSFNSIASLAPAGPGQSEYRYSDVRAYYLPPGFLLYRLRCVGKNGVASYSAIVRLNKDRNAPVFAAYPNPTSGRFSLSVMNVQDLPSCSFVLSTPEGKIIRRGTLQQAITSFDLSQQATSTYHLSVYREGRLVQHFTILLTQ